MGIKCDRTNITCKIKHPTEDNQVLYFLADTPHLLKNLRAGLCKNDIVIPNDIVEREQLPGNTITIKHLQDLIDFQKDKIFKLAPQLKQSDIDPAHFDKMDVGSALHVFSKATADALHDLVFKYGYDPQLLVTSWFIDKVHRWFQLMTSRERSRALSYHDKTKYNAAITLLLSFTDLIQRVMVVSRKDGKVVWKPWQTGMVMSTSAILELQKIFLDSGLPFLLTSRFTQDKLENFFSLVRKRHATPDALTFKNALKAITISQYLREVGNSNYQHDNSELIADFLDTVPQSKTQDFVSSDEMSAIEENMSEDCQESAVLEQLTPNFSQAELLPRDEEEVLYYIAGYTIGSVAKIHNLSCSDCLTSMKAQNPLTRDKDFAFLTNAKDFTGASLIYCEEQLFEQVFKAMELYIRKFEKTGKLIQKKKLKESLSKEILEFVPELLPTCHQITSKLVSKYLTFRLKLSALRMSEVIQEEVKQKNRGGERGSRSMTQKKLAKEVK